MQREYKIGTISKLLGISQETLRIYEKKGLVRPEKDPQTGYRYYHTWDLNNLLDVKWFRSYGIPLTTIQKMLNEASEDAVSAVLSKAESDLFLQIKRKEIELQRLSSLRSKIQSIPTHCGKHMICISPDFVYFRHRLCNHLLVKENSMPHMHQWLNLTPYPNHTFEVILPMEGEEEPPSDKTHYWGFSVTPEEAKYYGIPLQEPNRYVASKTSYYTIFFARGKGTFIDSFKEQVLQPLREQGFKPCGNAIGNLIVRAHRENQMIRYFETWVPIE